MLSKNTTFIIDCNHCKAKVAAEEKGRAEHSDWNAEGEPFSQILYLGRCPQCNSLLVGESWQTRFEEFDGEDLWSDIVRVYPNPPKVFYSSRIPQAVKTSLLEAERTLQANANLSTCVMLGRALEALCRNILSKDRTKESNKRLMLKEGIERLKKEGFINEMLFAWAQELQAVRNLAAHPEEGITVSNELASDLKILVYAIVDYVYDLTDRYKEFKSRAEVRRKKPPPRST